MLSKGHILASLFFGIIGITLLAVTPEAFSHQSGCHAWHSCPSDSGSYTCGDTGHCNGCPNNQYCKAGKPITSYKEAVSKQTTPQSSTSKQTSSEPAISTQTSNTNYLESQNEQLRKENNELKNDIQILHLQIAKLQEEINKINAIILDQQVIIPKKSDPKEEKTCFLIWCW